MYACICEAVTEHEVRAEIAAGADTVEEIAERTAASTGCGACVDRLRELIENAGLPAA